MSADEKRRDRELAELAKLADGSLEPERRAALERQVAASPRLQALLREQQQALRAIRALSAPAPRHLSDSVSKALDKPSRRPPALSPGVLAGAVLGVAAIVLGAVLALPGSKPPTPTLAQAAALAIRPAAADGVSGGDRAWGLDYPDLKRKHGWNDAGSRTDRLGNRAAKTVYYTKNRDRIAYTILSSGAVRVPDGTRTWRQGGRSWYRFQQGGRTVVAWERRGHMCVVSASGLQSRRLVDLITR